MSNPLSRLATRVAYVSTQLPRMAWYAGHLYVMRRLAEQARQQKTQSARSKRQSDPRIDQRLKVDMVALLEQDLANVEAGVYPLPADHDGSLLTLLDRSRLFFRDLPEVDKRRKRKATREVLNAKTRGRRPDCSTMSRIIEAMCARISSPSHAVAAWHTVATSKPSYPR